jgi:DNA-binding response OmpR family regulator
MTDAATAPDRLPRSAVLLIVEDDHALGDLLQRTLSEAGYQTARAVDGQQALAWLAHTCPQLLLLDVALPDMHGETVAALARDRYGEALPIVVLSGFLRSDPRLPPVKAAAVLPKPFDLADLLQTLPRVLR